MPLTLVLGPANSAKAGEVLGAFAAAAPRGALLVVPTAADAEHYSYELAEEGCVMRSVLTFSGLATEIAARAGFTARRLTELQRERVMRRVLRDARLGSLDAVASTPGFLAASLGLVAELERSMVTAQRFTTALSTWAREDPRRAPFARDAAALYAGYARELERLDAVDAELFVWQALDALRSAPGRWGADPVFFYGFDDLHGLERDAVETLARIVGTEVTVSLTFESGRTALGARAELVAELSALAGRVVELPPVDEYYAPEARAALHHLERSLFEPVVESRIDPGPAVRMLESAGELAEAELVAAEIKSILAAGTPPEEIVVIFRRLDPAQREALEQTFGRYGIPIAVSSRIPFAHTPLGRGLLSLARCALDEARASADDVLSYLRTPGLLRQTELADRLELEIRCNGLGSVAQARQVLSFELGEIDAVRTARDPLAELAHQGRRLLARPRRHEAALLSADEQLDARALAALLRGAAELAEVGERPGGSEVIELLERLEVGVHAGGSDAVLLSDALAVRARRFSAVFVCGLQEGVFPAAAASDPFLPDERRRELAACAGLRLRLRLREDALDRERYLFYACVSRARRQLVLSYRSSDEEGNIAAPSPFIDDVADVLDVEWRGSRRRRLLADVVWPSEEAPTPRERARAQAVAGPVSDPAGAPGAGGAPGADGDADGAFGGDRRLGPVALSQVRHTELLSAGALESYAECHMKWLVEKELQPVALEPQAEPLARGSYVHDVLEKLLSRLGAAVTPESLPEALRILEELIAEIPPAIAPGRSAALRRAVVDTIAADLRRYLEFEASNTAGWPPRALEQKFGFVDEEGSLPALELESQGERVSLRGAIDRIDVEPGGRRAIVRDYKSGSARPEHQGNRWRSEQRLQVALYMVAVRELLGLEPVAGLYQPLVGRELRPRGVYERDVPVGSGLFANDAREPAELAAELDHACERAVELAAELRAGNLAPSPDTCGRDGCRYPGICRAG